MQKLVAFTACVVIISLVGCEAILPPTPDERMKEIDVDLTRAGRHPYACGVDCAVCRLKDYERQPPVPQSKPYDATKRAFHFGDAVTITSGFHEGSRGIVYEAAEEGYRICLDITDAMQWTVRRVGIDRADILVNVPEACLSPYERPEPDLAPVPVPELKSADESDGA